MDFDFEEVYQALVKAGFSDEEIEQEIKEKFNEFQGFMTKEAILFLIAKEHGLSIITVDNQFDENNENEDLIDYNEFLINIEDITAGMDNLVVVGRITYIFHPREFVRKDGSLGKVGSFIIKDKTAKIKVTLWDDQCYLIGNEFFQLGEIVQVIGAYSKVGLNEEIEVHLSRQGKIRLSPKDLVI